MMLLDSARKLVSLPVWLFEGYPMTIRLAGVIALLCVTVLTGCKEEFPTARAEDCVERAAQDASRQIAATGSLFLSLSEDPNVKNFDIGSLQLTQIKFGDCASTSPGHFDCIVEYSVDLKGDGGEALAQLGQMLGTPIEGRKMESWAFEFGPTLTNCALK